MGIEELKTDLEFIVNSDNPIDERTERCTNVMSQVEGLYNTLNTCGKFDDNGQFVKDTSEVDGLKQQIVDITEQAETSQNKYAELEQKYRDRFFGGNSEPEKHITHGEYMSAIDKLFN